MPSKGRTTSRARKKSETGRVVELFAGVGGFRLGLEGMPEPFRQADDGAGAWRVIWGNQWEPSTKTQHAWRCYAENFGVPEAEWETGNDDIARVLDRAESTEDPFDIPDHELLVGGFPCQDYSVAKPLNQAHGIEGHKGVLWWQIYRLLERKRPPFVLLENVDRLLKSPAKQRGRDFAIILAAMSDLGYMVEWRVVNAAEYGFPQRRRRVFIVARHVESEMGFDREAFDGVEWMRSHGVFARALPSQCPNGQVGPHPHDFEIEGDAYEVSQRFGHGLKVSPFQNAGAMLGRKVWTRKVMPAFEGSFALLSSVLLPDSAVPEEYFVEGAERIGAWEYLKGSKSELRRHKGSGAEYRYAEGALPFPDPIDRPARTILTGEGGSGPSRFKHIIQTEDGRLRRLTPIELERLNGFPDDWTAGMSDVRRAFCMGNALVVGVVRRIGEVLSSDLDSRVSKD